MMQTFDQKLEHLSSFKKQAALARAGMVRHFQLLFKKGDEIRWLCGRDENTGVVMETRFQDACPHVIAKNTHNNKTYAVSAHEVVGIV